MRRRAQRHEATDGRGVEHHVPGEIERRGDVLGQAIHGGAEGEPLLEAAQIPVLAGAGRVVDADCEAIVREPWWDEAGLDPRMTCVSMGNPHVVFYCRDVAAVPLERIGPTGVDNGDSMDLLDLPSG